MIPERAQKLNPAGAAAIPPPATTVPPPPLPPMLAERALRPATDGRGAAWWLHECGASVDYPEGVEPHGSCRYCEMIGTWQPLYVLRQP